MSGCRLKAHRPRRHGHAGKLGEDEGKLEVSIDAERALNNDLKAALGAGERSENDRGPERGPFCGFCGSFSVICFPYVPLAYVITINESEARCADRMDAFDAFSMVSPLGLEPRTY